MVAEPLLSTLGLVNTLTNTHIILGFLNETHSLCPYSKAIIQEKSELQNESDWTLTEFMRKQHKCFPMVVYR